MFLNCIPAIEGLSGSVSASFGGSTGLSATAAPAGSCASRTAPTKRKPLRGKCFDEALLFAGIANHAPGYIQAGRQRRIGHDTPIPNGVDKVVFADDALPVADQVIEKVEYLWRYGADLGPAVQPGPVTSECVPL